MAQLTINQCQNCGKILAPGVTKCGKCHTEHSIAPAVVNPLRFTAAEAADYKAQFQEQVAACPKDSNALFAMGLTYLGLKNYELADEHFVKAVHLTPSNPDIYYYTALSMFHHRSVKNLSKAEMDRIEEWLDTAVQMQPKRKYLILQMVLRQGISSMGVNVDVDKKSPAELMMQARQTAQEEDELFEIEQHVLLTDEKTQKLIDALSKSEDQESEYSETLIQILEDYEDFCKYPKENDSEISEDGVQRLADPDNRARFFQTIYEPQKPRKISKPMYPIFGPIFRLAGSLFLCLILFFVAGGLEWIDAVELNPPLKEVQREYPNGADGLKGKKLKEYQAVYDHEKAKADSTVQAFKDNHYVFIYVTEDEAGKRHSSLTPFSDEVMANPPQGHRIMGLQHGWRGPAAIVLILLPLIWWGFKTIWKFRSIKAERERITNLNRENMAEYQAEMEFYKNRPTIEDYKLFCSLFAGPNDTSCVEEGDFVEMALEAAHLSEQDVQNGNGKIFFSCYLMDTDFDDDDDDDDDDRDCKDPQITLRDMPVRVCIAMRDHIMIMTGVWDSKYDSFSFENVSRLMYNQIANFKHQPSYSNLDIISNNNKVLSSVIYGYGGYPSLFQYQDTDPSDTMTYSTTRTSDFNEFYNSLVKMHADYNK